MFNDRGKKGSIYSSNVYVVLASSMLIDAVSLSGC